LKCKGFLDEQEKASRIVVTDASGRELFEKRRPAGEGESGGLFADIFACIEDYLAGGRLAAVGHRIVHGGRDFSGPVVIADQTLAALEALTPLAPLHQPRCLAPVRTVRSLQPRLTQIACFDTAS
jgi:acetate kinase